MNYALHLITFFKLKFNSILILHINIFNIKYQYYIIDSINTENYNQYLIISLFHK